MGLSLWAARHLTIILRPTFCSIVAPTPAGDLLLRTDYAWQDKIHFNVINDFNCQGACGTVEGAYRRNPARWGDRDRAVA